MTKEKYLELLDRFRIKEKSFRDLCNNSSVQFTLFDDKKAKIDAEKYHASAEAWKEAASILSDNSHLICPELHGK